MNSIQAILAQVEEILRPLGIRFVYVGGIVSSLLITRPGAPAPRPTRDVDIIVEVIGRNAYYELEDKLRLVGLTNDKSDDAPICRWRSGELIIDVMPTDGSLGFSNRWYPDAERTAVPISINLSQSVLVITAPFFIATKLEAFDNRGGRDYIHRDMEDIVSIVDGREQLFGEVQASPPQVRRFIADRFSELSVNIDFLDSISAHLLPDPGSQGRRQIVVDRIQNIASLKL